MKTAFFKPDHKQFELDDRNGVLLDNQRYYFIAYHEGKEGMSGENVRNNCFILKKILTKGKE